MAENFQHCFITTVFNRGGEKEIFGALVTEIKQGQSEVFIAEDMSNVLFMAEASHAGKIIYVEDSQRLSKTKTNIKSEYLISESISKCSEYEDKKEASNTLFEIGKNIPLHISNFKGHEITSITLI